ncbi:MAG: EamA family transporter RarD [Myxococcota bacterium]
MQGTSVRAGVILATTAYGLWGLFPAYFHLLKGVDPVRILAHRATWSAVLCAALLLVVFRETALRWWRSAERRVHLRWLVLTAVLLASNWGVYIHAVTSGQVLESSLGYFINPMVNVALGTVFLGERLSRAQRVAVALAALGVLHLAVQGPSVPWLALFLACSFGSYGLLRKKLAMEPMVASCVESLLMAPVAVTYLLFTRAEAPSTTATTDVLLVTTGAVSALPLFLFALGAKRLPYSTMGLLQYLTPSLQFVLAVTLFREPMGPAHVVTFALIWLALAISSVELVRRVLDERRASASGR